MKLIDDQKKWKKKIDVKNKKKFKYLIRWKKIVSCDDEWFSKKDLNNVVETLNNFKQKKAKNVNLNKRKFKKFELKFKKKRWKLYRVKQIKRNNFKINISLCFKKS